MSVVVDHVTKRFALAGTPAVADVSFAAPKGGITTLLGPSGAGKSTVLRLIAGLELPDEGTILIDGDDVANKPVQQRGVGVVFQSYALFNHMTVEENIAFGLAVRHVARPAIEQRVAELLSLMQVEELAGRYPAQLSGGQRQRVAFARALAVRPRVLLLDEPFGALDARVRLELREWLLRLHTKTGVTTILVTHDQQEALEISEQVVVMFDGRVAQAGPPEEIYDRPASARVAEFVGGSSELRGRVRSGRAEIGTLGFPAPESVREGDAVRAFVRSGDVRLLRASGSGAPEGQVVRVSRIGGQIKVTVAVDGSMVTVEMPRADFDTLGVGEGDRVQVEIQAAKVFAAPDGDQA
jgi:sulfate transport system ATP-binding protein